MFKSKDETEIYNIERAFWTKSRGRVEVGEGGGFGWGGVEGGGEKAYKCN